MIIEGYSRLGRGAGGGGDLPGKLLLTLQCLQAFTHSYIFGCLSTPYFRGYPGMPSLVIVALRKVQCANVVHTPPLYLSDSPHLTILTRYPLANRH